MTVPDIGLAVVVAAAIASVPRIVRRAIAIPIVMRFMVKSPAHTDESFFYLSIFTIEPL